MRKRQICLWASLIFFCLPVLFALPLYAAEQYRVKSGDSLHKIAKKYNISVDALKEANHLEGSALKPKQVLVIPGTSSKKAARKSREEKEHPRGNRLCREERRHACRCGGTYRCARLRNQAVE